MIGIRTLRVLIAPALFALAACFRRPDTVPITAGAGGDLQPDMSGYTLEAAMFGPVGAVIVFAIWAAIIWAARRYFAVPLAPSEDSGWTKQRGASEWEGRDSIINPLVGKERGKLSRYGLVLGFASPGLLCLLASPSGAMGIVPLGAMFLIISLIFVPDAVHVTPRWYTPKWHLSIKNGQVSFEREGENWAASVDQVASVEVGNTEQYTPGRYYGDIFAFNRLIKRDDTFRPVPRSEWQVFLFMADGTRRVIYHANAARDDCAALRASIAGAVEAARASVRPATISPAGPSAPALGEGFNL